LDLNGLLLTFVVDVRGTLDVGGTLIATKLSIHGGEVHNDGKIVLLPGHANVLFNEGTLSGSGDLTVNGGFLNAGTGTFETSGDLTVNGGFLNAGTFETSGHAVFKGSKPSANGGLIEVLNGGKIEFLTALDSSSKKDNSGLIINEGGEIDIQGRAQGSGHDKADALINGGTLKLLGGGTLNVTFDIGSHDSLVLDSSSQYKGAIVGFSQGDKIDVLDVLFTTGNNNLYNRPPTS
jgi:hypothetical protein